MKRLILLCLVVLATATGCGPRIGPGVVGPTPTEARGQLCGRQEQMSQSVSQSYPNPDACVEGRVALRDQAKQAIIDACVAFCATFPGCAPRPEPTLARVPNPSNWECNRRQEDGTIRATAIAVYDCQCWRP